MIITRAPEHFARQNLIKSLVNMSQWPQHTQRGSELIRLKSFEGSRGNHIEGIIILIGLPVKAWLIKIIKTATTARLTILMMCWMCHGVTIFWIVLHAAV